MLICQISDLHIKTPGKLSYRVVDTTGMLKRCVEHILAATPTLNALRSPHGIVRYQQSPSTFKMTETIRKRPTTTLRMKSRTRIND